MSMEKSVHTLMTYFLRHSVRVNKTRCFHRASYSLVKSREKVVQIKKEPLDISSFPTERIRNFSIIAHVDHGKSTLADRLLEITGTISRDQKNEQVLDKLQVERERGITVKAQTATLFYQYQGEKYLLNLIDTPGHVDFNYEVSRSLSACDGVLLLVDANQGVQAQTVANFYLAFEADLTIIAVINKIDLKGADIQNVTQQINTLFDVPEDEIMKVSAKTGLGVEKLLKTVIDRIPSPKGDVDGPLKALLFDSGYDRYKGAVPLIRIMDGQIKKGDKIVTAHESKVFEVSEVGILYPDQTPSTCLQAGQVGYLMAGMKHTADAQIGDTIQHQGAVVEPLPGFAPAKPMVFAGVYPIDQSELPSLKTALQKLLLNDSSVSFNLDSSPALGQGWRLGFLGLLHMEVFSQRLEQEFDANIIMTSPNVPYKVKIIGAKNIKHYGGELVTVLNPVLMPDPSIITEYFEPMVKGTIIAPDTYISSVTSLVMERRGEIISQTYIDNKRLMYNVILPLNEIVVDFYDTLKSFTSGYASFDYEDDGYRSSHLTKVDFLLNGKAIEEMTIISHHTKARNLAKTICQKLKIVIPSQMYEVVVQGVIGGKVICREVVKAKRKDVTAKLYGGDVTRRMKLLKRQTEGKKRMRQIGNVEVPKDAFISVLKRN